MHGRIALRIALLLVLTGAARLAAATPANACAAGTVHAVLAQAYPDGATPYRIDRGRLACVVRDAHAWLAVPLIAIQENEDGVRDGDLEVLVADPASGKLLARLRLEGRMDEDAIEVERVDFDDERYILANGADTIGLRIERANRSQLNPFDETTLSLIVLNRKRLRLVLDGLVVAQHNGEVDDRCQASYAETERTLAAAPSAHHGFPSLTIEDTTTIRHLGKTAAGNCRSMRDHRTTHRRTLHYDGDRYPLPQDWQALR